MSLATAARCFWCALPLVPYRTGVAATGCRHCDQPCTVPGCTACLRLSRTAPRG